MSPAHKNHQAGFSLIQVLVSVGLIAIIAMAFATMTTQQMQNIKIIERRTDWVDIKGQLITTLQDHATCACLLNADTTTDNDNRPLMVFNRALTNGTGQFELRRLRAGCGATSPLLAEAGQVLSSGLKIQSLRMTNLQPVAGGSDEWTSKLLVNFENPPAGMANNQIEILVRLTPNLSKPAGATTIASCRAPNTPSQPRIQLAARVGYSHTPKEGQFLTANTPGSVCFLSGVDDDAGNSMMSSEETTGYQDLKCRVGLNAAQTAWHGFAPLPASHVACEATCIRIVD